VNSLQRVTLDALRIDDERAFSHIGLYGELKQVLHKSQQQFLIPAPGATLSWDRATFLNLTYWNVGLATDVLCEARIPADVVAHIAWHSLAATNLHGNAAPTAQAMLFGEAIASAFDLYLIGRMVNHVPDAEFVETQIPIMAEAAAEAGADEAAFTALIESVAENPEQAFEDLRALLFDAARQLLTCTTPESAQTVFESLAGHRFGCLLHHYQLSNWLLHVRAHGAHDEAIDATVADMDAQLRAAPVSLNWLAEHWL
jgi:hypothetical protein